MPGSPGEQPVASVAVTEAAKSYLAGQLEFVAGRNTCFRLCTGEKQKMSTTVAESSPGDALVRQGNKVVLAIEPDLAARLQDNTIDIEQTGDGRKALIVL